MGQLRLAGQEALNAKDPQHPTFGWSPLRFVIESAIIEYNRS